MIACQSYFTFYNGFDWLTYGIQIILCVSQFLLSFLKFASILLYLINLPEIKTPHYHNYQSEGSISNTILNQLLIF